MNKLDENQIHFIKDCIIKYGFIIKNIQLANDISHSSLLYRLLSGKEPLKYPPPLKYSSPWYSLVEEGYALVSDVNFLEKLGENIIVIFQGLWKIKKEIVKNEKYVVYYNEHNMDWTLTKINEKQWLLELLASD